MRLGTVEETGEAVNANMNSDEDPSEEESEEVDNELLIDTIAAENEKERLNERENLSPEKISYDKIVVNSMQIIPSPIVNKNYTSYLEAVVGQPIVTEIANDDNSCQQNTLMYSVQSPAASGDNVEVIPTPPVMEEVQTRLSQRTTGANMEYVGVRAEKMTKKRNMQGLQKPGMMEVVKKGAEMLKENASQMMLLCGPPAPDEVERNDN